MSTDGTSLYGPSTGPNGFGSMKDLLDSKPHACSYVKYRPIHALKACRMWGSRILTADHVPA